MSTHADRIIDLYRTHLDLVVPDNNLYDGNYETVNFEGDELAEMLEGVKFKEDLTYLTHQYVEEDGNRLYTLIFDESNTTLLYAITTKLDDGSYITLLSEF